MAELPQHSNLLLHRVAETERKGQSPAGSRGVGVAKLFSFMAKNLEISSYELQTELLRV